MSLVRFRSKALGYDNCSYSSVFHEFQKTLKSACNLERLVVRYEVSKGQQLNMREWLSWWSTTLPRSGSRVRVPSRALKTRKRISEMDILFSCVQARPGGSVEVSVPLRSSQSEHPLDVLRRLALSKQEIASQSMRKRNKALLLRETFLI